jgi:hypothetical protein
MTKILFLVLIITFNNYSQKIDSLQNEIDNLKLELMNKRIEYQNENSKYQSFFIMGEIKDREEDYLQIWGSAIPTNDDFSSPGTTQEDNIIVLKPNKAKILYNYYNGGKHYFMYKGYSKNVFGADVPVRYYGDLPENISYKIKKLDDEADHIVNKIDLLNQTCKQIEYNNFFDEAMGLYKNSDYNASISKLQKILGENHINEEVEELLFLNYKELAKRDASNKKFDNALIWLNSAIQLKNLKNTNYAGLKESYFQICKLIAEDKSKLNDLDEAITYYSRSLQYDKTKIENIKEPYGDTYYLLGEREFDIGNIDKAKSYYNSSILINDEMYNRVKAKFENEKRPSIFLGICSIVPGLGQVLQNDLKTGLIHFGVFSSLTLGGYFLNKFADNIYEDYKIAGNEEDAIRLYDKADSNLKIAYTLYGLSGAMIVVSIVNSFIKSESHNSLFEFTLDESMHLNTVSFSDFNLSLKIIL